MGFGDHPDVRAVLDEEEGPTGEVPSTTDDWIASRICHILKIYPKLSMSMLQIGVGTSLSSKLWRPILERLIAEGIVDRRQVSATNPDGRSGSHVVISLAPSKQ